MKKITVNTRFVPVFRDAGFDLRDAQLAAKAFGQEHDHPHHPEEFIYSRYRNPTVVSVEEQLSTIEESEWALLTQSGMSAIDTALSLFQHKEKAGTWLFFSEIYGGTNTYIDEVLAARRGIPVERFVTEGNRHDMNELNILLKRLRPQFVYFETVSNPMLIVADGEEIIRMAKSAGSRVIVDNTFTTPYLWKPLQAGADLVVHSATKYLSGHGDLSAGVICGTDRELMKEAIKYRKLVGHMLSPDDAYRLGSFLRTFSLRFKQHCINAEAIAGELDHHPAVERVLYPGLQNHPTHAEAKKLFGDKGYGGMITFDLAGKTPGEKREKRDLFIQAVSEYIHLVPTLGDTDTILLPIEPVWGEKYPVPGMIRLSAGIEPTEEITGIIRKALDKLSRSA